MPHARTAARLPDLVRIVLAATLALLLAGPAHAAWRAMEGLDVASGKSSLLMIGDLDQRTALYARCIDGHAELFLDGFDGGDFEIASVGPVNLIITTDTGRTWSSEARYGREKSGYITTTWLTRETISAVVAELAAAKSAISIAIEFSDTGDISVWDTDAKGSTAAGRAFLAVCPQTSFVGLPELRPDPVPEPIPEPVPPPSDVPAPTLPPTTWRFEEIPNGQGGTQTSLSTRNTADDGRFLMICEADKTLSLTYVTEDMTSLQISGDSVPARIRIARESFFAPLGVATAAEDFGVLMSFDSKSNATIARALLPGPSVTITFPIQATGQEYERVFTTDNLAQAARQFVNWCLGG
jgi:hypothetical protein